ncbi:hypothetical protein BAY61_08300 [Prauserella marina]|uniref:Uncharacterized protein n=1 Tax=Prauserella marina TaxID=530584 RepID=A0A222VML0_9PSEU|nr:hypothetical protein [Prauserella marina]ASR34983.1 hypothetical protein BAY61_08300 [Prauserella marina]PWV85293.1 hypothetical protein DES30_1011320 [Prauserella marina]SDC00386.1 hypothetical protein SAMN05421630_10118 [Prauserella marina]
MDDDVSVTRLADDEPWNDRVPPGPRTRVRVLSVMGAVIVGCLVAAFLVGAGGLDSEPDRINAEPDDRTVIFPPERTSTVTAPPSTSAMPVDHPVTSTVVPVSTSEPPVTTTTEAPPSTTRPPPTTTEPTTDDPDDTTSPEDPPDEEPDPPTPPPATTTTTEPPDDDCWFWIFC